MSCAYDLLIGMQKNTQAINTYVKNDRILLCEVDKREIWIQMSIYSQNIHNKIIPCSPCPNTSAYDTVEFGVELAPL